MFGKLLDPFLDKILVKLYKKCLDSNEFIQSQVQKSMTNICAACSEQKIISWLSIQATGSKTH